MTMQTSKLLVAAALASALLAAPAFAHKAHKGHKAHGTPVAAECGANSDPVACRKEIAAARAAARTGALTPGNQANALARCQGVPPADRDLCRRRVEQGQASGSVEGGGRIIEYREVIELPPGKQD